MPTYRIRITELQRQKSSVNGNPRFLVVMIDINGNPVIAYTKPDSSLAYGISNYLPKGEKWPWLKVEIKEYRKKQTIMALDLLELTKEKKLELYRAGLYRFKAPPVCCRLWNESDWITFIDAYGGWLS
jgi:hypothetical protein